MITVFILEQLVSIHWYELEKLLLQEKEVDLLSVDCEDENPSVVRHRNESRPKYDTVDHLPKHDDQAEPTSVNTWVVENHTGFAKSVKYTCV